MVSRAVMLLLGGGGGGWGAVATWAVNVHKSTGIYLLAPDLELEDFQRVTLQYQLTTAA